MTKNLMNIPSTITVGYQKRNDTYTGKLAYVVYKDAKTERTLDKITKTLGVES